VLQLNEAVVEVAMVAPFAGTVLVAHDGAVTITAVVNVVLLLASQPVAGPPAFLGTTYQL
jgi:hypothetical protein